MFVIGSKKCLMKLRLIVFVIAWSDEKFACFIWFVCFNFLAGRLISFWFRWFENSSWLILFLVVLQIISPYHLYLNPRLVVKQYQFWRLVTNFLYFRKMGKVSAVHRLMNWYFLRLEVVDTLIFRFQFYYGKCPHFFMSTCLGQWFSFQIVFVYAYMDFSWFHFRGTNLILS